MKTIVIAIALGSLVACTEETITTEQEQQEVQQEMNKRGAEINYSLDGTFIFYESFNVFEGNYVNIQSQNIEYVFRQDGKVYIDDELHTYTFDGAYLAITNNENSYIFEWLLEPRAFMLSDGNKRLLFDKF